MISRIVFVKLVEAVLTFTGLLGGSFAYHREYGYHDVKCPHLSPVHVVQSLFEGRWYEVRRTTTPGQTQETCNTVDYRFRKEYDGWVLLIKSSTFDGEAYSSLTTKAKQPYEFRKSSLGIFNMNYDMIRTNPDMANTLYVLHLDEELALVYLCFQFEPFKVDMAWILSRSKTPDHLAMNLLEQKLPSQGIVLEMTDVDQQNCPQAMPGNRFILDEEEKHKAYLQCVDDLGTNVDFNDILFCYNEKTRT